MSFAYKLLHNLVKCNLSDYITVLQIFIILHRSYCLKFTKTHTNMVIRLFLFVLGCVNNWNLLNDNIVCASSFTLFKKYLGLLLLNKFTYKGRALNV